MSGCGRYAAIKGDVRWSRPSNEATDRRMTKSYKNEGGSTVHKTWFSAAAILALPNLQLSAISVVERRQVLREEHVGSSHQ